jgi:hypothetical protein
MNRTRLSTTVNAELLDSARNLRSGITDAALIDEALRTPVEPWLAGPPQVVAATTPSTRGTTPKGLA